MGGKWKELVGEGKYVGKEGGVGKLGTGEEKNSVRWFKVEPKARVGDEGEM